MGNQEAADTGQIFEKVTETLGQFSGETGSWSWGFKTAIYGEVRERGDWEESFPVSGVPATVLGSALTNHLGHD